MSSTSTVDNTVTSNAEQQQLVEGETDPTIASSALEQLKWIFDLCDQDHDGLITVEEFRSLGQHYLGAVSQVTYSPSLSLLSLYCVYPEVDHNFSVFVYSYDFVCDLCFSLVYSYVFCLFFNILCMALCSNILYESSFLCLFHT